MQMDYHNPVLLKETVNGLNIKEDGVYVDVTFGGGGHKNSSRQEEMLSIKPCGGCGSKPYLCKGV